MNSKLQNHRIASAGIANRMPRVLRNFLLGYLVLHLAAACLLVWFLTRTLSEQMIRGTREQMNGMALMLSEHINELDTGISDESLPKHLVELGTKTGFRFTVIDSAGTVIADSETGTKDIGYHGGRPEVMAADRSSPGFSTRYSNTLKKPMMYLAIVHRPQSGSVGGFVRVATPANVINSAIGSVQKYILLFALILSLLTGLLTVVFSSYLMRPLSHFSDAAKRIGTGQFDALPSFLSRNDEWASLAEAFRQMQIELTTREQHIVENRDQLEAVLSSMIEGVVALDSRRIVQIANRAACIMLGLTEPEINGRSFTDVVRYPELTEAITRTQQSHQFSRVEFETLGDDQRRIISARVSVLPGDSEEFDRSGLVIVLVDVSELRQLESMRRDFVANVSHELKTPLTSIKACAETLRLGAINDSSRNLHFVDQIESNAEVLDLQIQDLMQLTRVESGQQNWDIQSIDVNELCSRCVSQFESEAANRQVELIFVRSPDSPVIDADFDGLSTILKNLISNAIHYTPEGGKVELAPEVKDGQIYLRVTDSGIGIPPEHLERIFERFYRVDAARSREAGGTGLGLAIVKHLTRAFGGEVKVRSEVGKGSSFVVCFPSA